MTYLKAVHVMVYVVDLIVIPDIVKGGFSNTDQLTNEEADLEFWKILFNVIETLQRVLRSIRVGKQ